MSAEVMRMQSRWSGPEWVEAPLCYDPAGGGRPMPIRNARLCDPQPSLDVEGFQLFRHHSALADLTDFAAVERAHFPELANLVAEITGAPRILVLREEKTVRMSHSPNPALEFDPVRFVHIDYTSDKFAPFHETERFTCRPSKEVACFDFGRKQRGRSGSHGVTRGGDSIRRVAAYNVWRSLGEPPQDVPLALCDPRSVSAEDLTAKRWKHTGIYGKEWSGGAVLLRPNPAHRWFYYSDMEKTEVLLFKSYESEAHRPQPVAHTAFDNPHCPPGTGGRVSLELRIVALFL